MNWLRRAMIGRYGTDSLGYAMLAVSFLLLLLNRITDWQIFWMLAFVLLVVCYLRIFSRNISRRYQENMRFMRYWGPVQSRITGMAGYLKECRLYRHFRCPSCRQKLRVPRGKGKVSITCPGCRVQFIKKT